MTAIIKNHKKVASNVPGFQLKYGLIYGILATKPLKCSQLTLVETDFLNYQNPLQNASDALWFTTVEYQRLWVQMPHELLIFEFLISWIPDEVSK